MIGKIKASSTAKSGLVVMFSTLFSRLLGFVRIAVVASFFGASGAADVLNAVFTIPNNLRKLMAEGALSSAFIPELTKSHIIDPEGYRARKTVRLLFTFQIIILIPLVILSIIFAKPVIDILLEFRESEKMQLAVSLFRFFIPYVLLVSISAILMGVLNSHSKFFVPAITPILFSISVITCIFVFSSRLGVYSMALGVLAGGVLQIVFQLPSVIRKGYSFLPDLEFSYPPFRQILRLWYPIALTSLISVVSQQVAFLLASGLSDGSTSALANAIVFWQLPFGIFSTSISTVFFPRMAENIQKENAVELKKTIEQGLIFILFFLLPAGIAMWILAPHIISAALQRGNFTAENTIIASTVLRGYLPGMIFLGGYNFLQRLFYSSGDSKTPFKILTMVAILDIALSIMMINIGFGVLSLAVAHSISYFIGFIILFTKARKIASFLIEKDSIITLIKIIVVNLVFVFFAVLSYRLLDDKWKDGSSFFYFFAVMSMVIFLVILILFLYWRAGVTKRVFASVKRQL
ncbi:murein biosynthesis integral membrane protein MurJ [Spirochaetia bacterium 38H-sp]|uniref:Probable lipid II flippase MurJ n=1 Tax=Rarispira pelagica TaxID=3141764 RepID=A0ABU9UBC4_9SPIR